MKTPAHPSRNSLMEFIKNKLTEKELQVGIVYIHPEIGPGEEVVINRKRTNTDSPGHLLFIDFEPGVNWSHHCRYLLLGMDNEVKMEVNGQFPPDPEKLQLLLKPSNTQDWMLLTDKEYSDK